MTLRRSALRRRKPLSRRSKPARPHRQPAEANPARMLWKTPQAGKCQCCDRYVPMLERHHVIPQERIKRDGRHELLWDMENSMLLCAWPCHRRHTDAFRRIPIERVPDRALAWAVEYFGGDELAADFFRRYYDCSRSA